MLPLPIKVAMLFITFAVVDPDYPSFATVTGRGSIPRYILDKTLKVRLHPQLL